MGGIILLATGEIKASKGDLSDVSNLLGVPLSLTPIQQINLGAIDQARIADGQYLLTDIGSGGLKVQAGLTIGEEHYLLQGIFHDFRTTQIRGAAVLIRKLIQREQRSLSELIQTYSNNTPLPVRILNHEEAALYEQELPFMAAPDYLAFYDLNGSTGRFYTYLPETKQIIEMGPIVFRQGLSLPSVLVVIAFAIAHRARRIHAG